MNKTFYKQYGEKYNLLTRAKSLKKSTDPLFGGPPTNEKVLKSPKITVRKRLLIKLKKISTKFDILGVILKKRRCCIE